MISNSSNFDVFDFMLILKKWKKSILVIFFVTTIFSVIISLMLPKWYRANVTLMPPKNNMSGGLSSITSLVGSLPTAGLELFRGSKSSMRFLAILNSRTVMDQIIKKYNLQEVYKKKNIEDARKALYDKLTTQLDNEGTITISILDRSPKRAADIANAFVFYLDSLDRVLNFNEAHINRKFIEKRLKQNMDDLKQAEETFKNFQQKFGTVEIKEQTKAEIEMFADLQAQIVATEIELSVKQLSFEKTHPDIRFLKNKLKVLYKKRQELSGDIENPKSDSSDIFIPIKRIPDLAMQYGRLFREVEIQNKIFTMLTQQYEMAKIDEARDVPSVQVLDKAIPPIRKAKPKRAIIVLITTFSITLIFVLVVIVIERIKMLKEVDPAKYQKASSAFKFLTKE